MAEQINYKGKPIESLSVKELREALRETALEIRSLHERVVFWSSRRKEEK